MEKICTEVQINSIRHAEDLGILSDRAFQNSSIISDVLAKQDQSIDALQTITKSHKALAEANALCSRTEAHSIKQAVDSLSERVGRLPSISQDQYITLQAILNQVLEGQKALELLGRRADGHGTSRDEREKQSGMQDHDKRSEEQCPSERLSESVKRLWALASTTDTTFYSVDAQNIIDDFIELLSAASKNITSHLPNPNRKRKADNDDQDDTEDFDSHNGRNLKRIQGLLTASQSVSLNKKS